jgi:TRAP transporter TAXI family solute receptor
MKNRYVGWTIIAGLILLSASFVSAQDMGIITGGPKGTYYQFGLNLKTLVNSHGINLSVANSDGSVENVYAVYNRPNTQLGIVQADVLAFISRSQTNQTLKQIAKKTKLVLPLYNEEVHILGRTGINSFGDLAGRKVAIGEEGSGTYLTARLIFEISEIAPAEMVNIGTEQALAQLKAGKIDAMFYVAGYPVKLFKENVTSQDGLALVPITDKSVTEFYPSAKVPANTYPFQTEELQTIAVKAVLISYDFRSTHCDNVGKFAKIVFDNIEWLRKNGHPKWSQVDLAFNLKGWEQYDCVQKYLGKKGEIQRRKPSEINPVLDAIKQMF